MTNDATIGVSSFGTSQSNPFHHFRVRLPNRFDTGVTRFCSTTHTRPHDRNGPRNHGLCFFLRSFNRIVFRTATNADQNHHQYVMGNKKQEPLKRHGATLLPFALARKYVLWVPTWLASLKTRYYAQHAHTPSYKRHQDGHRPRSAWGANQRSSVLKWPILRSVRCYRSAACHVVHRQQLHREQMAQRRHRHRHPRQHFQRRRRLGKLPLDSRRGKQKMNDDAFLILAGRK